MNDRQVLTECTGFRPDLAHLTPLGLRGPDGRIPVIGRAAVREPRLHLVGYGDWTGPGVRRHHRRRAQRPGHRGRDRR